MGLSFSAHCSIPFVITAGLGPRHCLFVSENLHSKCVGQQRLPPKKTLISGFIFGGLSTQWKKYFVKMTANPRNQSWTGSWSGLEHAPSLWATPFREVHKTVQHALATLPLAFSSKVPKPSPLTLSLSLDLISFNRPAHGARQAPAS